MLRDIKWDKEKIKYKSKKKKNFSKKVDLKKTRIKICAIFGILVIIFIVPFFFTGVWVRKLTFFLEMIGITCVSIFGIIAGIVQFRPSFSKDMGFVRLAIVRIMSIFWVIISIKILIEDIPNYCMDIPKVVTSDYSICKGKLTSYYVNNGRATTTDLIIGENEFKVDGKFKSGSLVNGRKYSVEYLPNTKFVMDVRSYNW